jgi:hypothetical protein
MTGSLEGRNSVIVKVQQSLSSTDKRAWQLIYNEDRSLCREEPLTGPVLRRLRARPKAYFEIKMLGKRIKLGAEVAEQSW